MNISNELKNAITNNKLILFAGSGLSKSFGLPDWNKMVIEVIRIINKPDLNPFIQILENGTTMSAVDVLEFLKNDEKEIRSFIINNFSIDSKKDFSIHKKLLELTSGKIVTTNYDNSFELASNNEILPTNPTSKYNINEVNKDNNPFILKLHGSYSEPDNCIVFKEDYKKLYSEESNQAAPEKLRSLFSEFTFLFIGFSFNDPDINLIFSKLDKVFGGYNKHFIITNEPQKFNTYSFLESVKIENFVDEMPLIIDELLNFKNNNKASGTVSVVRKEDANVNTNTNKKIAVLSPNPIDLNFNIEIKNVINHIENIKAEFLIGTLNIKTLQIIEDYDLLIIVSKVFKEKIYIEDENLKSSLIGLKDICDNITNDKIPILLITNDKIDIDLNYSIINISSFKNDIIRRFFFKIKSKQFEFNDENIKSNSFLWENIEIENGLAYKASIYGNNRDLEIGRKCLTDVIGRIEEQSNIVNRLKNIYESNRLLNIKASGGIGKTTLIRKTSYELYNRGYYKHGVNFKSCENIKRVEDLEELLIEGFNFANIINFKEHLLQNYSNSKIDLLIILDNFETVVNVLNATDFEKVIELLKFSTDYGNIVITSRERICNDDFEDVFTLTPMITDDSIVLFQKFYQKQITDSEEIKILREDILEELLDNNPLAIKLVTTSRTPYKYIKELRDQIKANFFESINEEYSDVFKSKDDLNIQRVKSIFQSINYSYSSLNTKDKLAFELLSLFPDGIELNNFKKCFQKSKSSNNVSDTELKKLENKSLIENYNGILQLQPIIRRFAEFQFNKRKDNCKKYYDDAYSFNCFILDILGLIENKRSSSSAFKLFSLQKNNLLKVLDYIPDMEISNNGIVSKKEYFLNYIITIEGFLLNEKTIREFQEKTDNLLLFFEDLEWSEKLIKVMTFRQNYYAFEFEKSYKSLSEFMSVDEMEIRDIKNENYIEKLYKNYVSAIHSMEGFTFDLIKMSINNNDFSRAAFNDFYYLGIIDVYLSKKDDAFYYFEFKLRNNLLDAFELEKYITTLYMEEHLQIMQCTYILSKVKPIDNKIIKKLVVTNPYTSGLKNLMFAFNSTQYEDKKKFFEQALKKLFHIKYYYLEALYNYCLFLKVSDKTEYNLKLREGLELSKKFKYQYLDYLFSNIGNNNEEKYAFNYEYYELSGLENFVKQYNDKWEKTTL